MVNSMAKALNIHDVATLTSIEGKGFVRHADGTRSELVAGMKLSLGDIVITTPGGRASIEIADGRHVDLARSQGDAIKIDQTVLDVLSDIQDVKVTDLSVIYPFIASHVMTDPTVDPLSWVNGDHADDLSQAALMDERDEPAALNDADGGDLLSGNTYVVLHDNPVVTDTAPFITEPGHVDHGFNPTNVPAFVPSATPLAYLLAEHAPVTPAVDPVTPAVDPVTPAVDPVTPAVDPVTPATITLSPAPFAANFLDLSNPSLPVVDDEAGYLRYNLTSVNQDAPQNFHVWVTFGSGAETELLDPFSGDPLVVSPLGYERSGSDDFFVVNLEDHENETVHVRLEPIDPVINFTSNELNSSFLIGELGSETEVSPASLHITVTPDPVSYIESNGNEGTVTYHINLTNSNGDPITLDHALTVRWVFENNHFPGLTQEGTETIPAGSSTWPIEVPIPEELPEDLCTQGVDLNYYDQFTFGILLPNDVSVTSNNVLQTINPQTVPNALNPDMLSHPSEFLAASHDNLQVVNDARNEANSGVPGAEDSVSAAFQIGLLPEEVLQLDDDAPNVPIKFTIHSDQIHSLVGMNDNLLFNVQVYNGDLLLGTLDQLDANTGRIILNQLELTVGVDLTKVHIVSDTVAFADNVYVDEEIFHGRTLTFKLEGATQTASEFLINLDTQYASVSAFVNNDSALEHMSIQQFSVDPSAIVDGASALFSSNQTPDALPGIYDEYVKFSVKFDQQFGDATFDVKVNDGTVRQLHFGSTVDAPVYDYSNPILDPVDGVTIIGYPVLAYQSGSSADYSLVDYVFNPDLTSTVSFYVSLQNTENSPTYIVSLVQAGPAFDGSNHQFEDGLTPLEASTGPYTLVPDVHVSATFGADASVAAIDDEQLSFTIHLDRALSGDTSYQVTIVTDPSAPLTSQVYKGPVTVSAGSLDQSFTIAGHSLEGYENQNLYIMLANTTGPQVTFQDGNAPVQINVVNDPAYFVTVQELVAEPVTIVVTAPTTPFDDENQTLSDPVFSYHVVSEAAPSVTSVLFDVWSQPLDVNNLPNGDRVLVMTGLPIDLTADSTFTIPLANLTDGHQEYVFVSQDPSVADATSTPFDVVDMGYQLEVINGVDTITLFDVSDNTYTTVSGDQGGQGGGDGSQVELNDLITPDGSHSNILLDFGDQAFVAGEGAFATGEHESEHHGAHNPITDIVFDADHPGLISFTGDEGAITITPENVHQAIEFLAQSSQQIEGATVEFKVAVSETHDDTYVFHETASGYSVLNITNIEAVAALDSNQLTPTTIHIIDNH